MPILLFKPTIRRKDMDNILTCMVSDSIGPGSNNHLFSSSMAHYLKAAGGIALSSYYSALMLALDVLKLEPGDSVIITPLAPSIYIYILEAKGLKPLFVEVDPDSGIVLPDEMEQLLIKKPKALLMHYTLGFVPNMDKISQLGIPMIEDISQALGAKWGENLCGSIGQVTVCALTPQNIITTGNGGLVLVKKKSDYNYIKRLLEVSPEYTFLSDLNAAVGIAQLKGLERFIEARREIAEIFSRSVMRGRHSTLLQNEKGENVFFSFPVVVNSSMKEVRRFAKKNNIETHAAYKDSVITMYDKIYNDFPHSRALLLRCVLFPLYPALGKRNIESIAKVLAVLP